MGPAWVGVARKLGNPSPESPAWSSPQLTSTPTQLLGPLPDFSISGLQTWGQATPSRPHRQVRDPCTLCDASMISH